MSNCPDHFSDLLGKIFYASAFADRSIRKEEIEKLNELIQTDWQEERIISTFFECVNLNYDPEKILPEIEAHLTIYPDLFTDEMRSRIVNTSYRIMNASSGTNKSEIVFISRISSTLKKDQH